MNILSGIISNIQQSGSIMLVDIDVNGYQFSSMLIESIANTDWLKKENGIDLIFKETEVSLAKDLQGKISMRNRLPCIVKHIERGVLLSNVTLQFQNSFIVSAITTRSVDALQISIGDSIEALIKANEISLMKK